MTFTYRKQGIEVLFLYRKISENWDIVNKKIDADRCEGCVTVLRIIKGVCSVRP